MPDEILGIEKIDLILTHEMVEDLRALLREEGWEFEEGLRLILGAGMGAVRAALASPVDTAGAEKGETETPSAVETLRERLIQVESSLAVLRFKLYEIQEANRAWSLSTGAIQAENVGLNALVRRQKEEIAALKARLAVLEAERASGSSSEPAPPPAPKAMSWWTRLRRFWRKMISRAWR